MKFNKTIVVAISTLVLLAVFVPSCISTVNQEVDLRTQINAKIEDNMSRKDKLNKTISQVAQVSKKEVEALTNIIVGAVEARGPNPQGGDGNIVSMAQVQEAVPSISSIETLKNLQNTISGEREAWAQKQTELLSLHQQRNALLEKPVSAFFLKFGGKTDAIDVPIISSSRVKGEFDSGTDDIDVLDL
jgi:hypothetical protein